MDTLLNPRKICQSDSDDSEADVDASQSVTENKLGEIPQTIVVYPTARYLQVNPKNISSFDLLVLPPKRQRLLTPSPTNSSVSNNNNSRLSMISEDDNEQSNGENFENEKPVSTNSAKPSKSTNNNTNHNQTVGQERMIVPTKFVNVPPPASVAAGARKPKPWEKVTRFNLDNDESPQSRKNERSSQQTPVPAVVELFDDGDDAILGDDNDMHDAACSPEFPSTDNYIYYVNYSHEFRNVVTPNKMECTVFKTINEKEDINKNYLVDPYTTKPSKNPPIQVKPGGNTTVAYQLLTERGGGRQPARKIKQASYRLNGISGAIHDRTNKNNLVHLKEAPEGGNEDLSKLHKIFSQNAPPLKRRRVNAPGDFKEENEIFKKKEEAQLIYKICNELTNESEMVGFSNNTTGRVIPPPLQHKEVLSVFKNRRPVSRSDNESVLPTEKLSKLHDLPPPLQRYTEAGEAVSRRQNERSGTGGDGQDRKSQKNSTLFENKKKSSSAFASSQNLDSKDDLDFETDSTKGESTEESITIPPSLQSPHSPPPVSPYQPRSRSPFTIIVQESPMFVNHPHYHHPRPSFLYHPIMDLVADSQIRIEDVTEQYDSFMESHNNEAFKTETIMAATDPILTQKGSTSCPGFDLLLGDFDEDFEDDGVNLNSLRKSSSRLTHLNQFLRKTNPQITQSSSIHSLNAKDPVKTPTLDHFLEKRRKSDFFVGKLAGLSKSIMKLYQKSVKITKCAIKENLGDGMDAPSSKSLDVFKIIKNCGSKGSSIESKKNSLEYLIGRKPGTHEPEILFTNAQNKTPRKASPPTQILRKPQITQKDSQKSSEFLSSAAKKTSESCETIGASDESISSNVSTTGLLRRIVKLFSKSKARSHRPTGNERKVRIGKPRVEMGPSEFHSPSCELFKKGERSNVFRKISHDDNNNNTKNDPSIVLSRKGTLIEHTDSKELYRERRRRLFEELKEFQEDSLKAYIEASLAGKNAGMNLNKTMSPCKMLRKQFGESCSKESADLCPSLTRLTRRALSTSCLAVNRSDNVQWKGNHQLQLPSPPVVAMIMELERDLSVASKIRQAVPQRTNKKSQNKAKIPLICSTEEYSGGIIDYQPIEKEKSKKNARNNNNHVGFKSCKTKKKGILKLKK